MADTVYDFKKTDKLLYQPGKDPVLIEVPALPFVMLDGAGDPNGNPDFETAVELLYGLSYTIKMSKKSGNQPEGYFDFVVPPLEGLWWVPDGHFSLTERGNWLWTLMIRLPDFVTESVFHSTRAALGKKKPALPTNRLRFESYREGLCIQALHVGPYATEPETMLKIEDLMTRMNLVSRLDSDGRHHEIYLSDPRKGDPAAMKTILRHPVARR